MKARATIIGLVLAVAIGGAGGNAASTPQLGVLRLDVQRAGSGLELTVVPASGPAVSLSAAQMSGDCRARCRADVRVPAGTVTVVAKAAGMVMTYDGQCEPSGAVTVGAGSYPSCEIEGTPIEAGAPATPNAVLELEIDRDDTGGSGAKAIGAELTVAGRKIAVPDDCADPCLFTLTFDADATPTLTISETFTNPAWIAVFSGDCRPDGTVQIRRGQRAGCQIDNVGIEAAPPSQLSLANTAVKEGDAGTKTILVPIALDAPPLQDVTVAFATANGTATQPNDYIATSGTLTIPAGVASAAVPVQIVGDAVAEPTQTFTVTLSAPSGAVLADGVAVVTIVDNDPDTTPPAISTKASVIVEAKLAEGETIAVLYSTPPATDNVDGKVAVTCVAKSGAQFPLGTTTVNCTAKDLAGNVAASSFSVIVRLPTTTGAVTNPGNLDRTLHEVEPDQRVRVTAGGFRPGSTVELRFVTAAGEIVDLGTTPAGENGRIDARPKIPEAAPAGASQMTAVGVNASDQEFVRGWLLTVLG
jgi:hypothetical protein